MSSIVFARSRPEFIEEKLTCPFDESHQILPHRMQNHQVLCRKAILHDKTHHRHQYVRSLRQCSYNATHWFPKGEAVEQHEETCPDGEPWRSQGGTDLTVAMEKLCLKEEGSGAAYGSVGAPSGADPDEECWEGEAINGTYDPNEKIYGRDKQYLVKYQNMSKGRRRDFRAEDRLRHSEFNRDQTFNLKPVAGAPLILGILNSSWNNYGWCAFSPLQSAT